MAVKVETPPELKGQESQKLQQIYSYLYRLSENLNVALNSLTHDNFSSAAEYRMTGKGGSAIQTENTLGESYNELRALITNTAEIVRSQMTKIETELRSEYTAISSDWGTFQENINTTIEATASGIVQRYGYDALIQTLQEEAAGFSSYITSTEGYIRQGFIDYDDNGVPIIGIAIGQGLTSTTVTVDGEEFQQIDRTQSCAFYTADRVSFRINGVETAYVSNQKLYIYNVEILGDVVFRGEWALTTADGFKLQWIGGDA